MADAAATSPGLPRLAVTSAIGIAQILAWGSSFYLPAVLANPIARATGWSQTWIIGALSLGLLISGLISPRVGHLIQRFGGRPVLAASAILLAAGQVIQAVAPNLPVFVAAWAVLGLGMGAGLYDPAFATLGRLYGEHARGAITQVTLFGGSRLPYAGRSVRFWSSGSVGAAPASPMPRSRCPPSRISEHVRDSVLEAY